ncbi:MAG: chemotaxis-specific protein-glutamate methyltransferase CheB [Pseudomonadota bacterium]
MTTARPPVRVLIVDDSQTIRSLIRAVLAEDPRLTVVGEAGDPYEARDLIKSVHPDVLTLDVEMPRMNGLVFLRNLMRLRPMPVVMVSTRTSEQSEEAVTALSLGAVDCIDLKRVRADPDISNRLSETLLAAAAVRLDQFSGRATRPKVASDLSFVWTGQVVLIGASTGGVDALERVLSVYPANGPPTFVVQHMPAGFLISFARRLNSRVAPSVEIATPGKRAAPGRVYLAPGGDTHLALAPGPPVRTKLIQDTAGDMHVPSVDVLFRSALPLAETVIPVLLTGMGRDGADAMLALREAGAGTIVQDGASALIDGMPGAARAIGAAETVADLDQIGAEILRRSGRVSR